MKKNSLRVALNMSRLSVPEKIKKASLVVTAIAANPAVFANSSQLLTDVGSAGDALNAAWLQVNGGDRSKTAVMHDCENALMELMHHLAAYVEQQAANDDAVVHLAGLDVKRPPIQNLPEFSVLPAANHGAVIIKVKARRDTVYKWQYRKDGDSNAPWISAFFTGVSRATIAGLEKGVYWFRVIFIDADGEHEGETISAAVN